MPSTRSQGRALAAAQRHVGTGGLASAARSVSFGSPGSARFPACRTKWTSLTHGADPTGVGERDPQGADPVEAMLTIALGICKVVQAGVRRPVHPGGLWLALRFARSVCCDRVEW